MKTTKSIPDRLTVPWIIALYGFLHFGEDLRNTVSLIGYARDAKREDLVSMRLERAKRTALDVRAALLGLPRYVRPKAVEWLKAGVQSQRRQFPAR